MIPACKTIAQAGDAWTAVSLAPIPYKRSHQAGAKVGLNSSPLERQPSKRDGGHMLSQHAALSTESLGLVALLTG